MLDSFLEWLCNPRNYDWNLSHHEILPEKPPEFAAIPAGLDPRVVNLVRSSGIASLYFHQAAAIEFCLQGKDTVLSTSTASGKTLAYQIPVLDRLTRDPEACALLLFPLKALERDQRDAFLTLAGDSGLTAAVYDGDTSESERRKIRSHPPRVLVTNPDMLHLGLLAFHDIWRDFFSHLCFIVLDEVHTYKGIFGSHIAQVLLRTLRVCARYGARPQFIACSGTVANPGSFVSRLIGREPAVIDRSGAPTSKRHFIFLNPVLSPNTIAARLFVRALESGLKTIVFTRARKVTELITTWVLHDAPHLKNRISSYRAGFLPEERRYIEAKLFSGEMDGVISTSALEMGIDVGGLDLCLLVGYPGTIINTWQRGGRVGRAGRPSAIVMLAGNDALDQYFLRNPRDFFERSCEEAILDPFNNEVLKRHLPCAAAETPIFPEEEWSRQPEIQTALEELEKEGALYRGGDGSWRSASRRPHRGVDLRGIGESYAIFLEDRKTLIGSSSGMRAFTECHEGAVYLHRTRQYVVTKLDLQRRNVLVKPSNLSYYTRALNEKDTKILGTPIRTREFPGFTVREGRLKVTTHIVGYEKRRSSGQELIGMVDLDLPPLHFETVGIWIEIPDKVKDAIQSAGLHFMGGIHAMEHAAISMFPLFALCDRDDIGGISTPEHEQVCRAAVFIYDGHPGGVGLSHRAFEVIEELLEKTRLLVEKCPCEAGCPSCIHSPKCGSGNKPLDKKACLATLEFLLHPDTAFLTSKAETKLKTPSKPARPLIFPDLQSDMSEQKDLLRHRKENNVKTERPDMETAPGLGTLSKSPGSKRVAVPRLKRTVKESSGSSEITLSFEEVPKPATDPEDSRKELLQGPKRVVVFDVETQKLAQEVGGWKNISKMRLSLAVAHTEEDGFITFTENNVSELIKLLKGADLVVGFNHVGFDYEVLSAYSSERLRALPNLDILLHVKASLGFRLKLDHLAEITLGRKKSGHGLDAARWFREGKMDLIEQYCRDDVAITRDLYRFGLEKGFLLYRREGRGVSQIPVDWRREIGEAADERRMHEFGSR
ncbi:MAG: DEAD/DEAH box helicase [Desulfomonilaceae bacterium]